MSSRLTTPRDTQAFSEAGGEALGEGLSFQLSGVKAAP